jgi:hypothetical protein
MAEYSHDDGMEGGADPCGSRGGGPDVRTGTYDGDADGGTNDSGGAPGGGSDVSPPAGSGTGSQPMPEGWIK